MRLLDEWPSDSINFFFWHIYVKAVWIVHYITRLTIGCRSGKFEVLSHLLFPHSFVYVYIHVVTCIYTNR